MDWLLRNPAAHERCRDILCQDRRNTGPLLHGTKIDNDALQTCVLAVASVFSGLLARPPKGIRDRRFCLLTMTGSQVPENFKSVARSAGDRKYFRRSSRRARQVVAQVGDNRARRNASAPGSRRVYPKDAGFRRVIKKQIERSASIFRSGVLARYPRCAKTVLGKMIVSSEAMPWSEQTTTRSSGLAAFVRRIRNASNCSKSARTSSSMMASRSADQNRHVGSR